jgi:predicted dehydrogenase
MTSLPTTLPVPQFTPLRGGPVLRWGIIAPGHIARSFATGMRRHTDQLITAVASRSPERAASFAADFAVERVHATYEALVADPEVDIVYIASPHTSHREHALLAIAAGKHVLVEKPIGISAAEAREIDAAATAAGVYALEAMWTRFQPKSVLIHQLVADGALGTVREVEASLGFAFPPVAEHRVLNPALGGGALLDLGVYPIAFALGILGAPNGIDVRGRRATTGVDAHAVIIGSHPGGAFSRLSTSLDARAGNRATIVGETARIEVPSQFHEAGEFDLIVGEDRLHWEDPTDVRESDALAFQAVAAAADIAAGRTESPLHPRAASIAVLDVIDSARVTLAAVSLG